MLIPWGEQAVAIIQQQWQRRETFCWFIMERFALRVLPAPLWGMFIVGRSDYQTGFARGLGVKLMPYPLAPLLKGSKMRG